MAGGPYNIPRNYKGENKILYVFSKKSFITTAVGGLIGVAFYYFFKACGITIVGTIFLLLFALIGFIIGTLKVPETNNFEITRKTGGEPIDKVIVRWYKFKRKHKRIYVYKEGEQKDERGIN